jgi:hypothetical protein
LRAVFIDLLAQAAQDVGGESSISRLQVQPLVNEHQFGPVLVDPTNTAPRCAAVREMVTGGLSERRALAVVRMSAAALRYAPRRVQIPIPGCATASSRWPIAIAEMAPA